MSCIVVFKIIEYIFNGCPKAGLFWLILSFLVDFRSAEYLLGFLNINKHLTHEF